VFVLLAGCAAPSTPLDEDGADETPPRKTLPKFVPRSDAPEGGRIRPMTSSAPEGTEDPPSSPTTGTTAASPTSTSGTTSPSPTTTASTTGPSPTTTSPGPTTGTASPTPTTASPTPTTSASSTPSPSPSPTTQPPPVDGNIRVAASDAQVDPGFALDIVGTGSDRIGAVQISKSFGTVVLDDEPMSVYTYERIPWVEFEYTIYQGLAVQGDAWTVYWFYCQEGALKWVYHESTHGQALRFESATGSCGDGAQSLVRVTFPATNMTPPISVADQTITGAEIRYAAGSGWMVSGGRNWTLYAFQVVDCTSECGSPGWEELHVVLWNQTEQRAAFGILYLRSDAPSEVQFLYGLRLPAVVRVSDTKQATWTT
jgi:hypothetical protein